MAIAYSSVCDTSVVAYLAYLACSIEDGERVDFFERLCRAGGGGTCYSRGDRLGGAVARVLSGDCSKAGLAQVRLALGASAGGDGSGVGGVVGCDSAGCEGQDVGLAGDCVGSGDSGLGDSAGCRPEDDGVQCGASGLRGSSLPASGSSAAAVDQDALRVGGESCGVDSGSPVSEKTLANRAKRARKRAAKLRKKNGFVSGGRVVASGVVTSGVPEWRRGAVAVGARVSVAETRRELSQFAVCSDDVRRELAESRAARFIAENKAAVLKAEKQRRVMAAKLQTGEAERREELARLKLKEQLEVQRKKDVSYVPGFAETVVSGSVPGLTPVASESSLSPSDSISVAERQRLEEKLKDLLMENNSLKVKNGLLQDKFERAGRYREFKETADGVSPAQRQRDYLASYDAYTTEVINEICFDCGQEVCDCGTWEDKE